MKKITKVALSAALAVGLGIGGVSLAGCADNTDLDIRVQGDYIQWTKDGENWENLISVDDLKGKDADEWTIGDDGFWYFNGGKTDYVAIGQDADKWTIGDDGFWYFNDEKTDYVAEGKDGNGIVSVEIDQDKSDETKTTYVITFDNGKTFTFEVANGYVAPAPVSKAKIEILEDFKKEYIMGEDLDVTGGILTYTNEIGKESYVAITEQMVSGFSSKTTGERYLVITYEGETILYKYSVVNPVFAQIGVPYYVSIEATGAEADIMHSVFIFKEDGKIEMWTTPVLPTLNNKDELFKDQTSSTVLADVAEKYEKTVIDGKYVYTFDMNIEQNSIATTVTIEDEDTISVEQIIQGVDDSYTVTLKAAESEDEGLEYGEYYVCEDGEGWSALQFNKDGTMIAFYTEETPTVENIEELQEIALGSAQGANQVYSSKMVDGTLTITAGLANISINEDGTLLFTVEDPEPATFTFTKLVLSQADLATFAQIGVPYYTTVPKEMTGAETDMHSIFIFNEDGTITLCQTAILPTLNNADWLFTDETQGLIGIIEEYEKTIVDGKYVVKADVPAGESLTVKTTLTIEDENTITVEQFIQEGDEPYTVTLKKAGNEDEELYDTYYVAKQAHGWSILQVQNDGRVLSFIAGEEPTFDNIEQLKELALGASQGGYMDMTAMSVVDGKLTFAVADLNFVVNEDGTIIASGADAVLFTELGQEIIEVPAVQHGVPYYVSIEATGAEADVMHSVFIFKADGTIDMWTTPILPTLNNKDELFKEQTSSNVLVDVAEEYEKTIIDGKYVYTFEMTVNAGNDTVITIITIEDENTISVEQIIQATDDPYTVTLKAAGNEDEGLEYDHAYITAAATEGMWAGFVFTADGQVTLYQFTQQPTLDNIDELIEAAEGVEAAVQSVAYVSSMKDGKLTFDFGDAGGLMFINENGTLSFCPNPSYEQYIIFAKLGQEIIEAPVVQYGVPYYVAMDMGTEINYSTFIFNDNKTISMWTTTVLPTLNNASELFKEGTAAATLVDTVSDYSKNIVDGKYVFSFDMQINGNPIATTVTIEDENTINVEQIIQEGQPAYEVTLNAAGTEDEGLEYGEYYVCEDGEGWIVYQINKDGTMISFGTETEPTVENVEELKKSASESGTTSVEYTSKLVEGELAIFPADWFFISINEDGSLLVKTDVASATFTFTKLA